MEYTGELVLPKNHVMVKEEEMEYLEGGGLGKHWYNKRSFIATVIDVGIAIYFGVSGYLSIARAKNIIKSLTGRTMKAKIAARLSSYVGSVFANFFGAVIDIITAISGFSVGGMIAYGMDRLDGKNDGYILA